MSKTLSLADLLKPYNRSAIARELNGRGCPTSRDRINRMALGTTVPTVREIPALADILRIDVGELTKIIASQAVA